MRFTRRSLTRWIGIAVLVLFVAGPALTLAQDLADYSDPNKLPKRDPFLILIKPPPMPFAPIKPVTSSAPPPPPAPKPAQFKVNAIAGEAPQFVAVLSYKGKDYIAEPGWEPPDKAFVVKKIGPGKDGSIGVEVLDRNTNRFRSVGY